MLAEAQLIQQVWLLTAEVAIAPGLVWILNWSTLRRHWLLCFSQAATLGWPCLVVQAGA